MRLHRSNCTSRGALVIFFSLLGGCSAFSGYPTNFQNTDAVITADEPYLSAEVRTNEDNPSDTARNGMTQQQYRDTVVFRRIEVIDINYYDFESKLSTAYNSFNVAADLTALILNGLGATTGVATTKAALAAASAGVIGAKGVVSTDVFYQKTLPALIAQMRANRQTTLVAIKAGLLLNIEKYSLDAALLDVNNYFLAGTLPSAVAQITSKAGAEQNAADAQLAALRSVRFTVPAQGSSTQQILAWLYPPDGDQNGVLITGNLQKLTDWANKDAIDTAIRNAPWQTWVYATDPASENARQRAIQQLGIKVK